MIDILISSFNKKSMRKTNDRIINFIIGHNRLVKRTYLFRERRLFNILKSPHIDKDAREQVEIIKYNILLTCMFCKRTFLIMMNTINISSSVSVTIK